MKRLALGLCLLPSLAVADAPWIGNWAWMPESCENREYTTNANPWPLQFLADEFIGTEVSCSLDTIAITPIPNTWMFEMTCQSEGDTNPEQMMIMLPDRDTLYILYGIGGPEVYGRCAQQ